MCEVGVDTLEGEMNRIKFIIINLDLDLELTLFYGKLGYKYLFYYIMFCKFYRFTSGNVTST